MAATHQSRIERLKRLEKLLPRGRAPEDCPDCACLLEILGSAYGEDSNDKARRRALQRDLDELVRTGRIEAVNPGSKPLRYRWASPDLEEDDVVWDYNLRVIRELVANTVPKRHLDRLWKALVTDAELSVLDEGRLRVLPDTLRLQPPALYTEVVSAVVTALARRCALQVRYRDAEDQRSDAQLHPQALVQRGPLPYLFALKNDETEPVRLYALHRMLQASTLTQVPARAAAGFDLDQAIARGLVDFGHGEQIDLELRVRGYLVPLLLACPLAAEQRFEDEPDGSDFDLRIWARVPSPGQLLRWLLGAGANLEVVAPLDLRRVVAAQARKMAGLYQGAGEG